MKNIELLPISEEAQKRLNEFATQYKRYAQVIVEIVSFNEGRLIVRVEQKELVNGKMLTNSCYATLFPIIFEIVTFVHG